MANVDEHYSAPAVVKCAIEGDLEGIINYHKDGFDLVGFQTSILCWLWQHGHETQYHELQEYLENLPSAPVYRAM